MKKKEKKWETEITHECMTTNQDAESKIQSSAQQNKYEQRRKWTEAMSHPAPFVFFHNNVHYKLPDNLADSGYGRKEERVFPQQHAWKKKKKKREKNPDFGKIGDFRSDGGHGDFFEKRSEMHTSNGVIDRSGGGTHDLREKKNEGSITWTKYPQKILPKETTSTLMTISLRQFLVERKQWKREKNKNKRKK